ncbi:MAG: hypothetical protein ABGZ24_07760, partial [Fuerstiella sp.]
MSSAQTLRHHTQGQPFCPTGIPGHILQAALQGRLPDAAFRISGDVSGTALAGFWTLSSQSLLERDRTMKTSTQVRTIDPVEVQKLS